MKQYTKQSVTKGEWGIVAEAEYDDKDYTIARQYFDGDWQDHYAFYIDGKRQSKTYFGETAHYDVARVFNDHVHWTQTVSGDML